MLVHGVLAQDVKRYNLQCAKMCGGKMYTRSASFVVGLEKPTRTQAPSITGIETVETEFR